MMRNNRSTSSSGFSGDAHSSAIVSWVDVNISLTKFSIKEIKLEPSNLPYNLPKNSVYGTLLFTFIPLYKFSNASS